MKKVLDDIDSKLLDYIDGKLAGSQLEDLKIKISNSEYVKSRLSALLAVRNALSNQALEDPSKSFTQSVMNNLDRAPASSRISSRNGMLLLMGVVVAMGIGVGLVDSGFFNSLNGMLSLPTTPKLPVDISLPTSIPLNGKILVNTIIALNLGLAFLILDRTVLRPFFHRRSKAHF